jgi:predicted alpha/beta hydrolase family esterase
MPMNRLSFPSIVVFSEDDAYVSPARATTFAKAWGSTAISVGPAGHINSASGLGEWPAGRAMLEALMNP